MRTKAIFILVVMCLILTGNTSVVQAAGNFRVLHSFPGNATDGGGPLDGPTVSGLTIYGTASEYGSGGNGLAFRMNADADGAGYSILHNFPSIPNDGNTPNGPLAVSGSTLYGSAEYGGSSNGGVIFRMNTDGTAFSILHNFTGSAGDGKWPEGSPIISGASLYGASYFGGSSNNGTVYKMNNDGTAFSLLHSFAGGNDGSHPNNSLTLSGSVIYGMASESGSSNNGTIFKMNIDGTGYGILHNFSDSTSGGASPLGSVTVSGSMLYGMTTFGGSGNQGTVFSMNIDGTGYSVLRSFTGGAGNGKYPYGSLTLSGSTLYGMTEMGGSSSQGVIFQMNADGTAFNILHNFSGGSGDGTYPHGSLTLSGSTLYGVTLDGGSNNNGVLFSLDVPEPATMSLLALGGLATLRLRRQQR